jgi:hypothetical protein
MTKCFGLVLSIRISIYTDAAVSTGPLLRLIPQLVQNLNHFVIGIKKQLNYSAGNSAVIQ